MRASQWCVLENRIEIRTIFVIKHELRTDVEPESDTALILAPARTKYRTIGSFDSTAAHHSGVTW